MILRSMSGFAPEYRDVTHHTALAVRYSKRCGDDCYGIQVEGSEAGVPAAIAAMLSEFVARGTTYERAHDILEEARNMLLSRQWLEEHGGQEGTA